MKVFAIELDLQRFEANSEEEAIQKFRSFLEGIVKLPDKSEKREGIRGWGVIFRDYFSMWVEGRADI